MLSLITAHLKDLPDDGRNEDVFKMLRSSAAILHGINNLRNNYSMAHPALLQIVGGDKLIIPFC
ncbi:abortive infection family protein [Escherichia coli]|nr:abortive infection family protein [Escherichia coli]